jgi:hypothetical protein
MKVKTAARFNFFKNILCVLLLLFFFISIQATASTSNNSIFPKKTFYFGVNMGDGSTEWKYLVDTSDPGNPSVTTPSSVSEGGPSWGVVLGYDVNKNFALELQYMQFANANIQLFSDSPYLDQSGNQIPGIISRTDAYSLSGKFLVQIGHTHLRAFAEIGVGTVRRVDPLVNYQVSTNPPPFSNYTGANRTVSCVTPYLSSGLVYNLTPHWMIESGFQYYTGFGKSQVDPVASFIPFAWDAYGRLAYQL